MRSSFSASFASSTAPGGVAWPVAKIYATLDARFPEVEQVKRDDAETIYGVLDPGGPPFIVHLVHSASGDGTADVISLYALFRGYGTTPAMVGRLNAELEISAAELIGEDLIVGVSVRPLEGFSEKLFNLLIDVWRADLHRTLGVLQARHDAQAAAGLLTPETAGRFAARTRGRDAFNFAAAFKARLTSCPDCDGSGRRGLFRRPCATCGGDGSIAR